MPLPLVLLSLPALSSACATWCARDAYGASHCGHPECTACTECSARVSCTPIKKEDISHESCERWCKAEHAAAHCPACACRACTFCAVSKAAESDASSPRTAQLESEAPQQEAAPSEEQTTPAASPPAAAPDARAAALASLNSLASVLELKSTSWDDAFKPFDRKGNGLISSSEVQRVFHNFGLPPLPLHGLPSTVTTLKGVDYRALLRQISGGAGSSMRPPGAPPPPTPTASPAALEALKSLAAALTTKGLPWNDAFKPFDRKGDGLISASEVQRVFQGAGVAPLPLHGLPSTVTTLHGIDYRALAGLLRGELPTSKRERTAEAAESAGDIIAGNLIF